MKVKIDRTHIMSIDTSSWEAVRERRSIVKITRVDEEEVDLLFLRHILHVLHEAGKVAQVATAKIYSSAVLYG